MSKNLLFQFVVLNKGLPYPLDGLLQIDVVGIWFFQSDWRIIVGRVTKKCQRYDSIVTEENVMHVSDKIKLRFEFKV